MIWRSTSRLFIGGIFMACLLLSAGTLQASDSEGLGPEQPLLDPNQGLSDCADGDVVYSDNFSSSSSGWMVSSGFGFDWGYATDDGEYRVFITAPQFIAWSESPMPAGTLPDKFCIEGDAKHRVTGSLTDFGGLGLALFDNGGSTRYFVELASSNGVFRITKNDSGSWTQIRGWTPLSAIRGPNQSNKITLIFNGEQLTVYINGSFGASFAMPKPENAGVFAATFSEPNMNGRFDNFKVIRRND